VVGYFEKVLNADKMNSVILAVEDLTEPYIKIPCMKITCLLIDKQRTRKLYSRTLHDKHPLVFLRLSFRVNGPKLHKKKDWGHCRDIEYMDEDNLCP
jgi:hypothetical protein